MKNLFYIAVIVCLTSCKKESTPAPEPSVSSTEYPYTKLVGTTWARLIFTDDYGAYWFQFLHIKSDTTIGIYTASADELQIKRPEVIYPCKIITQPNHNDSIEVTILGNSDDVYYTTSDTTVITTYFYYDDFYVYYHKVK